MSGGLPLRQDLVGLQPYGAPQLTVPVRLNVNENPYPPSAEVVAAVTDAVREAAASLNRYPDREAEQLRAAIGSYLFKQEALSFPVSCLWPANGSNEVMVQLLQAFGGPGRRALGFAPTYSMYPDYCRDTFTEYLTSPRNSDFSMDAEAVVQAVQETQPDVVLVASPNNPTGTAVDLSLIRAICESAPGVVVVDEAYAEFRRSGTPSALSLIQDFPQLVVTRTLSKAFAFAGGRVGYLVSHEAVVDAVRLVRLPYHLSALTQAAAIAALEHSSDLLARVADLRTTRDETVEWLRSRGLHAADSDANFVLFGIFDDATAVWQGLLDRGVLIRQTGPQGWLRVSMGTPEEMATFRQALEEVVPA